MSGSDSSGEMKRREFLGVGLLALDQALDGPGRPPRTNARARATSNASNLVDPKRVLRIPG
jgi:hypothetical protein